MPATTTIICAFCHVAVETGDATACSVCGTRHHMDCWEQNEGCAVALCAGGPALPYMGAGTPGSDGGRIHIDFGPDEPRQETRRGTYVGLGLAALVVVIGLIALIARGSESPSPSAGQGVSAIVQDATPAAAAGVRPLRGETAKTIATEKQRVKKRTTQAKGKQRVHRTVIEQQQAALRQQSAPPSSGGNATPNARTPVNPAPHAPRRQRELGGSGTEKANPLVDSSFND